MAFNVIILLIILNVTLQNVYEVKVVKQYLDYQIDTTQKVDPETIKPCFTKYFKSNRTLTSQMCFQKDTAFTTSILIGDPSKSSTHQILNLTLDLHSPWTYFITSQCSYCDQPKKQPFFRDNYTELLNIYKSCQDSCFDDNESLNKFTPNSSRLNQSSQHGMIQQQGESMMGQFFYEKLWLLVYDENKTLSFKDLIKSKLMKNKHKLLNDILYIKRLKIFGVQRMMSDRKFHGGLGLGYIDEDADDELIQSGTNLVDKLLSTSDSNNVFGLYLGMIYEYIPDLVMTVGGYNIAYSHNNYSLIHYYKLSQKRQQNWALDVESLRIGLHNNMSQLNFTRTQAILSTSASYIGIPLSMIGSFLNTLNSMEGANCYLVDEQYNQVFCRNIKKYHFIRFSYELKFLNSNETVSLDSFGIFKYCKSEAREIVNEFDFFLSSADELFDCTLNIRVSTEDKLILGEPFFKQHYIIFDQDNNQIGLLPAARSQFWIDQFNQTWFLQIMNWLILVFVFGILFICCYRNIQKLQKRIKKYFRQRKHKTELIEIQKLTNVKNDETFTNQENE